ncbi:hypothetical protein Tco_1221592 [Tanacetum coccineum]
MIMRFNEIHKFSDNTLQQIDEALDYRVKEFKVNRMNPGLNTRFWTRKDVDRSKEFMFAIQKQLKTRRIFQNLESFVANGVRMIGNCGYTEGADPVITLSSYKDGKVRYFDLTILPEQEGLTPGQSTSLCRSPLVKITKVECEYKEIVRTEYGASTGTTNKLRNSILESCGACGSEGHNNHMKAYSQQGMLKSLCRDDIKESSKRLHKLRNESKITTCSTETNLEESKDYEPESKINSKIARIQFVFSGVTSLRGRLLGL